MWFSKRKYISAIDFQLRVLMSNNIFECINIVKIDIGENLKTSRLIECLAIGKSTNWSKGIELLGSLTSLEGVNTDRIPS